MATAGNITAVLTLNATSFNEGLGKSLEAVDKFKTAFSKTIAPMSKDTELLRNALEMLETTLLGASKGVSKFSADAKSLSQFSSYASSVNKLANALKILSSNELDVATSMNTINNMFKAFRDTLNGVEVKVNGVVSSFNSLKAGETGAKTATEQLKATFTGLSSAVNPAKMSLIDWGNIERQAYLDGQRQAENLRILQREFRALALGVQQFNSAGSQYSARLNENQASLDRVVASDERLRGLRQQVASATNQASASTEKNTVANDKNSQSMNRQATATRGLSKAMSSLKMIGSMVASMMVYNFAHNLITATRETVNAKSEMNGYFQMLGFGRSQINDFNSALDETIAKFPRLNKYSLGETISSIGVEFELTTKEMKKAMPVVSMITSEYLRAGRNVNEASLAVKDILQGEFQRLSRETGVKGDQLKEAGWSGDKSDVMGLLKALDKVGKARNWDVFVAKANSLNDAVLILQNRFGEWSADMVEKVQPAILNVFNSFMSVAEPFGKVIESITDWITSEGIGQSIVQWGGLATAISGFSLALIHARTGAGLLQVAQMGLTKTIGATILGIEAETLAETKLGDSIVATITGLEAEEVATIGKTKAIFGSLLGLDMAILKENGFRIALLKSTTQMDLARLKAMGLGEQIGLLGLSFGLPLAIVGAFAVAVGVLAVKTMEATKKMEKFYNLVNKGDDIVNEAKESVKSLKDRQKELKKTQDNYVKGSQEYLNVGKAIKELDTDIADAKKKVKESQEAVNIAQKSQENFDDGKLRSQLELERQINSALIDVGISSEDARVLSSDYLREANDGAEQLQRTLQNLAYQNRNTANAVALNSKKLQQAGFSPEEIEVRIKPLIEADDWIKSGKEKRENASSLTDVVMGWLEEQYGQITHAITEFTINWDTTGWVSAFQGLVQGFAHGVSKLPLFGDFWNWVFEENNIKEQYGGKGWEGLNQFFNDSANNLLRLISDSFIRAFTDYDPKFIYDKFWKMLGDFFEDPLGAIGIDLSGFDFFGSIMDAILPAPASASDGSSDHPSFMEDISAILGFDIQTWITNFNADPLGTLGISLPNIDILGLITSLIPIGGEGGFDIGAWLGSIFNIDGIVTSFTSNLNIIFTTASSIATSVSGVFSNLKSMIWGHIQGILTNVTTTFTNIKTSATNQINGLKDGVTGAINKVTDAFKHMRDSILDSAKRIMDGVKEKFDKVKDTIGGFYHKLTNPSEWFSGSGTRSYSSQPKPRTARRLFAPVTRTVTGKHGAGVNPYIKPQQQVSLKELVNMLGGDKTVNLGNFLSLFDGSGFGGWDFAKAHKDTIFKEGKSWNAKSPSLNGVTLGDGFPVRRFWSGEAKGFTWSEFMSVATAIFSAIPYKFYMDSDWKGNWVSALLSGAMNCSDGADALIALANLFGFSGSKQHMNLKDGTGHFFAIINGKKMDTTHFQNSGSWSPLSGAGVPTRSYVRRNGQTQDNKTVNVTVDMSNSVIYGVDDLDKRIEDGVDKGMQKHLNDPFTVAI